jgi:putative acetyltransferase
MAITIERARAATREVQELVSELEQILAGSYADDQRHGLSIEQLFAPDVRFFVARVDGMAMGCGGLALLRDYAEVKRMYTKPSARRRGVASALLGRIEAEAREAGAAALRLETGVHQPEAIGLYEGWGFRRRDAFGPYAQMPLRAIELSLFYEKPL